MKIKFKDLPLGARIKLEKESYQVYVVLQTHGDGLLCHHEPNPKNKTTQCLFSFCDDEFNLESFVEFLT